MASSTKWPAPLELTGYHECACSTPSSNPTAIATQPTCAFGSNRSGPVIFSWSIPESAKRSVVGLIANDATVAKARLLDFLCQQNLRPSQIQAAQIPPLRCRPPAVEVHRRLRCLSGRGRRRAGQSDTVGSLVTGLWGRNPRPKRFETRPVMERH